MEEQDSKELALESMTMAEKAAGDQKRIADAAERIATTLEVIAEVIADALRNRPPRDEDWRNT